jgi:CRP-like cAMP-binding protein
VLIILKGKNTPICSLSLLSRVEKYVTIITLSQISTQRTTLNKPISSPSGVLSIELLRNQNLFKGLSDDLLNDLRKYMRFVEYRKNDYILHKGAAGDSLLLLFSGRLQVISLSEEGKEVGLNFIEPGDYFGEISIIDGGPRSASVISTATSVVGFLPKNQALWLFHNNPTIAERILQRLCHTIRQEIHYRSNLGSSKAYTRIYSVLFGNTKADQAKLLVQKPGMPKPLLSVENLPNQQSIAMMANVSRETVSRALQALIKAGIIQKDTKRIVIQDPTLLEKLAKGEIDVTQLKINRS